MNIGFLVKMRFLYKSRDGIRSELMAEKRFQKPFIPQIGSDIHVFSNECEVGSTVSSVWWRTGLSSLGPNDEIIVHTAEQLYCDGNVDESKAKHIQLLTRNMWTVK